VEYGFTIADNPYDFLRVKNIKITDFTSAKSEFYESNLEKLNLKDTITADLKIISLHRDVLKMLRCNYSNPDLKTEITILNSYLEWLNKIEMEF
jgi:hypothetical protein